MTCPECQSSNTDVVPLADAYVRECQDCGHINPEEPQDEDQ
jgi:uncharacterized Zn finger protein